MQRYYIKKHYIDGDLVIKRAKELGISRKELGISVNRKRSIMDRYIYGLSKPNIYVIEDIARELKLEVKQLIK